MLKLGGEWSQTRGFHPHWTKSLWNVHVDGRGEADSSKGKRGVEKKMMMNNEQ